METIGKYGPFMVNYGKTVENHSFYGKLWKKNDGKSLWVKEL